MTKHQQRRMIFVSLIVFFSVIIVSLIVYALRQNINLFFTPSDIQNNAVPLQSRIRIGGMVEKGSLKRYENLSLRFKVTDLSNSITIEYQGILPDLFREGQGVVALGQLQSKELFLADEILAKHDENYMPPEVAKALQKNGNQLKQELNKAKNNL